MAEQQSHPFSWLADLLPTHRPLSMLDIGCGDCPEGETLLAGGVQVTGIDFDEQAIAAAHTRLPDARFICADAAVLTEGWTAPFDAVLFRRPDIAAQPARWQKILTLTPGWLSPGGRIILTTPGPQEAALARQLLEQAGFLFATKEQLDVEGECFLVTATGTAAAKPGRVPAAAMKVMRWEEEENNPAMYCDPKTGLCSPAPEKNGILLEKEDVKTS